MSLIKNGYIVASAYNQIPFIEQQEHVAEEYKDDLGVLIELLQKHNLPQSVYVKLLHIHFHQDEGDIVAFSEIDASPLGRIPFLAPLRPLPDAQVYGCHYLVDATGALQAFEYTTDNKCLDLAAYPAFIAEFCAIVSDRKLEGKFGLGVKSGVAEFGKWTELDYPEQRATFLLPAGVSTPKSESLIEWTTQTQFINPAVDDRNIAHHAYEHKEYSHAHDSSQEPGNDDAAVINGVTTKGGLAMSGIPLNIGSDFYHIVAAISAAA